MTHFTETLKSLGFDVNRNELGYSLAYKQHVLFRGKPTKPFERSLALVGSEYAAWQQAPSEEIVGAFILESLSSMGGYGLRIDNNNAGYIAKIVTALDGTTITWANGHKSARYALFALYTHLEQSKIIALPDIDFCSYWGVAP